MGLLRAGIEAAAGVLSEQWRDYLYCDAIPNDVLMVKGRKRTGGNDNILTDGSIIAVNEGQAMIVVQQGAIVEFCAEAGEFLFEGGTEPSIFYGDLADSVINSFKRVGQRIVFGGDTAKDLRVYFFNTKEIMGNKYGTPAPISCRVVDANIGLDTDIRVRCNGEYSYRIVDPILFYSALAGNVTDSYRVDQLSNTLRSEFLTALQPGFGALSAMGIRFSMFPAHTMELAQALQTQLTEAWTKKRGIALVGVGINTIAALPEDEDRIRDLQMTAVMRDPNMRMANMSMAQGAALRDAANNQAGAMVGFANMNMMQSAAGAMASNGMYDASQPYQYQNAYQVTVPGQAMPHPQQAAAPAADSWTCPNCGSQNTGKFCMECGTPKAAAAAPAGAWICPNCGSQNTGKFCMECGKPKPANGWDCSCGHHNDNAAKFCMECGKPRP